jgi:hypothetical protein
MHCERAMQNQPKWWSEKHTSAWDRVKAAMKRDWEQTKADVSSKGRELNQDAGDTIKQAAGKQPIPLASVANPPDAGDIESGKDSDWNRVESSYRYGVGAREQYGNEDWNDRVESKMREEWNDLKSGRTWDEVKAAVRRGWDRAKS